MSIKLDQLRQIDRQLFEETKDLKTLANLKKSLKVKDALDVSVGHLSLLLERVVIELMFSSCQPYDSFYAAFDSKAEKKRLLQNESPNFIKNNHAKSLIDSEDLEYIIDQMLDASTDNSWDGTKQSYLLILKLLSSIKGINYPAQAMNNWLGFVINKANPGKMSDIGYNLVWEDGLPPLEYFLRVLILLEKLDNCSYFSNDNIQQTLEMLAALYPSGYSGESSAVKKGVYQKAYQALGLGTLNYIQNNKKWTQKIIDEVESKDNREHWKEYLLHLGKASLAEPSAQWINKATQSTSLLGEKDVAEFFCQIIDCVVKEYPTEHQFSVLYNETVLVGMVYSVVCSKIDGTQQHIMKLAEYCNRKVPDIGVNSFVVVRACIYGFNQIKDELSIYSLFNLQGTFDKQKKKHNKKIVELAESTLKNISKTKNLSLENLKDLAITWNSSQDDNHQLQDGEADDLGIIMHFKEIGCRLEESADALGIFPDEEYARRPPYTGQYVFENDRVIALAIPMAKKLKISWSYLGKLNQLKYLLVGDDNAKNLRKEILKLTNLQDLSLRQCEYSSLPKELFHMPKLESLEVGYALNTFLTEIDIPPNTTIKKLRLERSNIHSLPKFVGKLGALEYLSLVGNGMTEIPEINCPLKKLNMMYNLSLKTIPVS